MEKEDRRRKETRGGKNRVKEMKGHEREGKGKIVKGEMKGQKRRGKQ